MSKSPAQNLRELALSQCLKYPPFVRDHRGRKISQIGPSKFCCLQGFSQRQLPFPPVAGKVDIDPLIDRLRILVSTVHHREWHQIFFANRDAKLFFCFSDCGLKEGLAGFNMPGSSTCPVTIHESRSLP